MYFGKIYITHTHVKRKQTLQISDKILNKCIINRYIYLSEYVHRFVM